MRNLLALLLLLSAPALADRAPYPDAYGYGAKAQVGRAGGTFSVVPITSTADSGAGTLRACLEATGNRICVCQTGGTITLATAITQDSGEGSVYLACQQAPGDGLQVVRPEGSAITSMVVLGGDDTVLRGLRFRNVDAAGTSSTAAVRLDNTAERVLLDQLSAAFQSDEGFVLGTSTAVDGPYDVTLQRSIVAEGMSVGDVGHAVLGNAENESILRNAFLTVAVRTPLLSGSSGQESINNVSYIVEDPASWQTMPADCAGSEGLASRVTILENEWSEKTGLGLTRVPILTNKQTTCTAVDGCDGLSVYQSGNVSWVVGTQYDCRLSGSTTPNPDDLGCAGDETFDVYACVDSYIATHITSESPYPPPLLDIEGAGVADAIVAAAGASPRDAVDTCAVAHRTNGTGALLTDTSAGCNGGPEALAEGTWCEWQGGDTDADSMCDTWETTYFGGISAVATDDHDTDGWSNIEEFLNGTVPTTDDAPVVQPAQMHLGDAYLLGI